MSIQASRVSHALLRSVATRKYSAQVSPASSPAGAGAGLASTVLSNKISVATLDNGSAVARITVAYKAGSRYEPAGEAGLTHILRALCGYSTAGSSGFLIIRNLQQFGANLTATVDRELVSYTLEASKENLEAAVNYLNEVATKQKFNPWEFETALEQVKYEIAGLPPQTRAMDLLHRAAFRRGLGNSLFCSPRQIGKISSESLQHFVANNFTAGRCAVGAVGISLERAVAVAQTLNAPSDAGKPDAPSVFKSGELRKEMGGELTHVALAAQGSGANNFKEALALSVLAKALGSGPQVKWGADNSPLGKAIGSELGDNPFAVNAFNVSYSDNGLFGILLSTSRDQAGKAVQAAGQVLRKAGSLGGDILKRGRAQLQLEVLTAKESPNGMSADLAHQALINGGIKKGTEIAEEIAKLSDSDIANVANKVAKGPLSMGAAGCLINVPYVDELK